jgi:hypothetical protein
MIIDVEIFDLNDPTQHNKSFLIILVIKKNSAQIIIKNLSLILSIYNFKNKGSMHYLGQKTLQIFNSENNK